jgi:K+-sensing histidine kinase KdpD
MTNGVFINRSIEGVLPSASLHNVKNCTKEILEKELQGREIASKYNPDLKFRIEGSEPAFTVNIVSAKVKEQNGWWRTRMKHGADFVRSTLTVEGILPYVVAFSVTILATMVGMAMSPYVDEENFCMLYLLGVVLVACRYGRGPSFVTCLLSVIGYDFFVVSPHYTLMRYEASCILTFIAMFVVAFTMTGLTAQVKQHAREMDMRVKERTHELAVANEALKVEVASRATAEERLKEAVEELARSNTALAQFAKIASHDLQEPLRSLRGLTDLLSRRYVGKLDDKADEFLGHISDCGLRMERIVKSVLDHAKVQGCDRPFSTINLNDSVKEAMQNLEVAIKESGAKITVDELPTVKGDALQLVQLFQNFLANAIKFRRDEPLKVKITCAQSVGSDESAAYLDGDDELPKAFWHVSVRDNGSGFDSRHTKDVFTMFKRLHSGQIYAGTGIGLAICKSIVERHGGNIWVDTMKNGGSTFHFTMPIVAGEAQMDDQIARKA